MRELFEKRLYDLPEICRLTSVTRHQIRGQRERGEFPEPVRLGDRTYRWLGSELQQWWAARLAERDAA